MSAMTSGASPDERSGEEARLTAAPPEGRRPQSETMSGAPQGGVPADRRETWKITRAEHLAWAKKRALEYCDAGDPAQAIVSMGSDLGKHDETRGHAGIQLGVMMLLAGQITTPEQARRFIEGFN